MEYPVLQTKLTVSAPGDQSEQEADRVAEQVMRMPLRESEPVGQHTAPPATLQRKCGACAEEEEEGKLLRKESGAGPTTNAPAPAAVGDVLRSSGRPLDAETRAYFEPRFGLDFGDVRVHTDAAAADSARSVDARAYTVGRDIVFGGGGYEPRTDEGRRLIAHELTHVLQQRAHAPGGAGRLQRKKCERIAPKASTTAGQVSTLVTKPSKNGAPCACLVVVHNKEQNAHETAERMHERCAFNLALVEPENTARNIQIPGHTEDPKKPAEGCDPNALFHPDIVKQCLNDEQSCKDFVANNQGTKDTATIMKFVQMKFFLAIKDCSQTFTLPVVALHNNDIEDTKGYLKAKGKAGTADLKKDLDKTITEPDKDDPAVKTGKQQVKELKALIQKKFGEDVKQKMTEVGGKTNIFRWCVSPDIIKCHIGNPDQPDHVIWVTNEVDFDKLNQKDVNVALQKEELKAGESEGDLSTLFIVLKQMSIARASLIHELTHELADAVMTIEAIEKEIEQLSPATDITDLPPWIGRRWHWLVQIKRRLMTSFRLDAVKATPAIDTTKLHFTNIETPGFSFAEQTDDERRQNFELISTIIKTLGIKNCCGADAAAETATEDKIKEDLKLKNIQERDKQLKENAKKETAEAGGTKAP